MLAPSIDTAVIPISVSTLIPEDALGISLYLQDEERGNWRLYRAPHCPLTSKDLKSLENRGVTRLYVSCDEESKYQEHLRNNLENVLNNESLHVKQRFSMLNLVVRDVLSDVFRRGDVTDRIEELQELGELTVQVVCREDAAVNELRGALLHDYHTFTHSANVAYYCVMLGKALGITDHRELSAIALGGLLHDAGKLDIPNSLLTKPDRLTEEELRVVRRHPLLGFRKLSLQGNLSFAQLMMVYQHHERIDGGGYPVRSVDNEIHDWAKICAVVDVFEALTSNRPYRPGMSTERACEIMRRKPGTLFDESMLSCWMQVIGQG
jgi:HD-GYP domain-containing protein (c-di-GMP phosphodiesterase class II)